MIPSQEHPARSTLQGIPSQDDNLTGIPCQEYPTRDTLPGRAQRDVAQPAHLHSMMRRAVRITGSTAASAAVSRATAARQPPAPLSAGQQLPGSRQCRCQQGNSCQAAASTAVSRATAARQLPAPLSAGQQPLHNAAEARHTLHPEAGWRATVFGRMYTGSRVPPLTCSQVTSHRWVTLPSVQPTSRTTPPSCRAP
jgi:hypothetical protein